MEPNLGLADAQRGEVLRLLTALLADEYTLATQARGYSWNVVGPQFLFLHSFFREQFRDLDAVVDEVAERVRALGGVAPGGAEIPRHARLAARPAGQPPARDMIAALLADHEAVARQVRADLTACADGHGDRVTGDFLAGLLARHERWARQLRAFLEAPSGDALPGAGERGA
jgi:starvation-inducible DNA-binding protein